MRNNFDECTAAMAESEAEERIAALAAMIQDWIVDGVMFLVHTACWILAFIFFGTILFFGSFWVIGNAMILWDNPLHHLEKLF